MTTMPAPTTRSRWRRLRIALTGWFDTEAAAEAQGEVDSNERRVDWLRVVPFLLLHVACFSVIWVGYSPIAVGVAIALYLVRMFAITGFYHRYFAHRTFKTSRLGQFLFAVVGATAVQRGPLWWSAHHRHHHKHSDEESDPHSPRQHGLIWSHMLWFTSRANFATRWDLVRDLARYPELRFIDRFDILVPTVFGLALYAFGATLQAYAPELGTSGWQMVVWGLVISTVALMHGTFTINSLAHRIGRRRFETDDDSRNSLVLALITLGEGWHNNHHRYPGSTRQGFYWWEIDITYYVLRALAAVGLIWDLHPVPARILEDGRRAPAGAQR